MIYSLSILKTVLYIQTRKDFQSSFSSITFSQALDPPTPRSTSIDSHANLPIPNDVQLAYPAAIPPNYVYSTASAAPSSS